MPRIGLKADASGVSWRRNGLDLVEQSASDRGLADVDFWYSAIYISYTHRLALVHYLGRQYIHIEEASTRETLMSTFLLAQQFVQRTEA